MRGPPWTREEEEELKRELLAGGSIEGVAKSLGRTQSAIKSRVYQLCMVLKGPGAQPVEKRRDHLALKGKR